MRLKVVVGVLRSHVCVCMCVLKCICGVNIDSGNLVYASVRCNLHIASLSSIRWPGHGAFMWFASINGLV